VKEQDKTLWSQS